MNKVWDHTAKHMPLSLLHCNEPRGFLQTWKTTAFPCIQTSNHLQHLIPGFPFCVCVCCMGGGKTTLVQTSFWAMLIMMLPSKWPKCWPFMLSPTSSLSLPFLYLPPLPPLSLPQLVLSGKIVSCLFPCPYSLYWMFVRSGLRSYTACKALIIFACITIYWIDVSFQ